MIRQYSSIIIDYEQVEVEIGQNEGYGIEPEFFVV